MVFLSDGGDSVRNLQAYLHPDSEHWLDWFHITMRISVLQQQVKTLKDEQPEELEAVLRPQDVATAFTTSRMSVMRGRPPAFAGGMMTLLD